MPNRSKQKGNRAERQVVELLKAYGLEAYRIPLSGAVNGFKSDIEIRHNGQTLKLESKCRNGSFQRIYNWLNGNDCLVLKADRKEPLAVIALDLLAKLLSQIPHNLAENVTGKTSPNQHSDIGTFDGSSVASPSRDLLDVAGVKVNPPRFSSIRIANEDDLRRRDQELEAERNKYMK